MAPRLIHRAWFGPDPLPGRYADYGRAWAELNPTHTVQLWDRDAAEKLVAGYPECHRIWRHIETHGATSGLDVAAGYRPEVGTATQLADVFGYCVIHAQGGVYVNCDMEPLRPLDDAPMPTGAWAALEDDVHVNNGAIGGDGGDDFWTVLLALLPRRFDAMPGQAMHLVTGWGLIGEAMAIHPGLSVMARHLWHFASYMQVPVGGDATAYRQEAVAAGAIVLHHWGHRRPEAWNHD